MTLKIIRIEAEKMFVQKTSNLGHITDQITQELGEFMCTHFHI